MVGIWFDCMSMGIAFIPFYILFFIPIPIRSHRFYMLFFRILFTLTNIFLFVFNIIDIPYFEYTLKRSTSDMFATVGYGEDINNLWLTFAAQYWYFVLLFAGIIVGLDFWFRWCVKRITLTKNKIWQQFIYFPVAVLLFFLIGRGGWQLKPTSIITASKYTEAQNVPLVLNSCFTIIKTWNKKHLEIKNYMPEEEARKTYNPNHQYTKTNTAFNLPQNTNVVIIVLESISSEFTGVLNDNGETYTPFLDSIFRESFLFTNAYANGKKSIEAIPAITAGIPTLMDSPFISSPYSGNQIDALPLLLNKLGYQSSFFHAATNGSMNFDGFASLAGYQNYYGRYEYDNDDHFDGHWGIFDEYFLPWTAQQLNAEKTPFFSTIFTISSHHPYTIPDHHGDRFTTGKDLMYDATLYADYTLRVFFNEAQKYDWFNNTLFIITADHSPPSKNNRYNNRYGMYQIPLAFYHPNDKRFKGQSDEVAQQTDIMPTILDLLDYKRSFFAFGNSLFREGKRFAISYINEIYGLVKDEHMLLYSKDDEPIQLTNYKKDPYFLDNAMSNESQKTEKLQHFIEAIIQQYNHALIKNKMSAK